jgi:hypothetical protein
MKPSTRPAPVPTYRGSHAPRVTLGVAKRARRGASDAPPPAWRGDDDLPALLRAWAIACAGHLRMAPGAVVAPANLVGWLAARPPHPASLAA